MLKRNDKIVHLHLHKSFNGKTDFYYANISDMFDALSSTIIGVAPQTLRNYRINENEFYANKYCTIEIITLD